MRACVLVVVGLLMGIGGTLGAQQVLGNDVEGANQRFGDAARSQDAATYAQLVADDAEFVSPVGGLIGKETRVAQIRAGSVPSSPVVFRDRPGYRVRMYGDTAILSWQDPPTGERNAQRVVRVFVKLKGTWRLAHYQRTFIAANP